MSGFKTKTIRKVIRGKLDAWIKTVEDIDVQTLIRRDAIVTGGSIASMLLGENVKDYDVYFKTNETAIAVANYYLKIFSDSYGERHPKQGKLNGEVRVMPVTNLDGDTEDVVTIAWVGSRHGIYSGETAPDEAAEMVAAELSEDDQNAVELEMGTTKRYHPVYISPNAITLSNKVQIVLRFTGSADEIHANYDFAHCKNVYEYDSDKLTLNMLALECLLSKTLRYTGSLYPLCSMFRTKKFIERGWKMSAGEMLKIGYQIGKIDFKNLEQVREQLVGVDALYFHMLMAKMEEKEKLGETIDESCVVALIDEVFNS